ncbi:MAG: MmgE/PrpD family protein [Alphaproteobacteria bacterium]
MADAADRSNTISEDIAGFITGFDLDHAPDAAIGLSQVAFLDTIGVMLAGSREPAARIVCDVAAAEGAAQVATVVGSTVRTSPGNAALVNGTATQALDYDLSFMIGQSTAALIPALLPQAECNDATPRQVIASYIVGVEICARLAKCFPTLSSEGGWHGAGVLGTVAAAAALAKLTNQPARVIPAIIGISASMASGVSANFGTMTKPLHAGLAARNGALAVSLGEKGFTGSAAALEGPHGFFSSLAQGLAWDTGGFDDLGQRFYLIDPGYKIKPFACGGLLHCSIEAALKLRGQAQPQIADISRIKIGVSQHAKNRAIDRYPWSEDSSRFSLRYLVAYALIHGAPRLSAFREEAFADDQVRALSERCEIVLDDEFATLTGSGYSPGRVTISFGDAERIEHAVYVPTGTRKTPMGADQIKEKFMACATRVLSDQGAWQLYDYLRGFSTHPTLGDLWPMIAASDGD